ncbi:hypothetical protein M2139_001423 [Enterococcus sp. PF1-24]|uniref:DUF3397 domain-containing protein n=1 Tax=unclassified Enterococcus TaxID=2608891 RepID=UPI0024750150|nr:MULTISPECIES: DUF3397 domain-containing protein [unclassified Enterococcus]MDH6364438.1 hypothetical protein [Enterococcus sp. PFB1-1]MDH6401539.1 hypothetical protein [Enterococcus sp. PF1-24]
MKSFSLIIIFWYVFPVIAIFACNFLKTSVPTIKRLKWKTADISVPFLVIGLSELTKAVYHRSIVPYFMIALLILGIGVAVFHSRYYKEILYGRYFKMFWRLVFLLCLILYLTLIILSIIHFFI